MSLWPTAKTRPWNVSRVLKMTVMVSSPHSTSGDPAPSLFHPPAHPPTASSKSLPMMPLGISTARAAVQQRSRSKPDLQQQHGALKAGQGRGQGAGGDLMLSLVERGLKSRRVR